MNSEPNATPGVQRHAAALLAAALLALNGPLAAPAAEPIENSACLECHADKTLTKANAAGKEISLFVDVARLAASVHKTNTCASCHTDITSGHPDNNVPAQPVNCRRCHEKPSESYDTSVHGLALAKGRKNSATCSDCHRGHKILPSTDPRSSIYQTNLVATCGKCHKGATENFVQTKVHVNAAATSGGASVGEQINRWVRRIYLVLIVGTIGLMLAHNLLLFARKVRARYRAANLSVLRMSLSQRMQHAVLAASFFALAVTGFALKFPDSWIAKALGSNEMFQHWSHRIAGVVLLVTGAYHIIYLLSTREGRQLGKDFLPVKKDLKDVTDNARYLVGLSPAKPKIGRFGYAEKIEYWAVVWGTVIMGVTGLIIWFKMDVTELLPRWAADVALTIHYYEAILACLAIVVWHFYHVIFDPDVYPLNWACWNGRVSKHWQEGEHPLDPRPEDKSLGGKEKERPGCAAEPPPTQP